MMPLIDFSCFIAASITTYAARCQRIAAISTLFRRAFDILIEAARQRRTPLIPREPLCDCFAGVVKGAEPSADFSFGAISVMRVACLSRCELSRTRVMLFMFAQRASDFAAARR